MASADKVAIVGWDGACWPVLRRYMADGELPVLQRLIAEGSHGGLSSTVPFHSGPAWTSLVTGVNPGKHNIFHFCRTIGYDMRFVNGSFRCADAVWDLVGRTGMKVAAVNIPMTFPPEEVNGVMVSGMDAPSLDSRFTYPFDLRNELVESGYMITWGSSEFKENKREEFAAKILEMARKRGELVLRLLKDLDPSFMIVNFAAPDRAQHFFWHTIGEREGDWVRETYRELDTILGDILAAVDDSTSVMLVSDHGFGPLYGTVGLGEWLQRERLFTLKSRIPRYALRKLGDTIKRVGGRRGLDLTLMRSPWVASQLSTAKIDAWLPDWSCTRAWFPPTEGGIRVNVKGREPQGIVKMGQEYEELRDRIIDGVQGLCDSGGTKMVERVYRREEVYSGSYVENAPDLIVEPANGYAIGKKSSSAKTRAHGQSHKSGDHTRIGVFAAKGPDFSKTNVITDASVYDIVPTVLHLLGLQVPDYMDGQVLQEAFAHDSEAAKRPVQRMPSAYTEKQRIRARLTALQSNHDTR